MKRKRTFDRRRDAELFEASIRRARQLGQLATEVIGSNATLEEFLVEWWDTYAVTHLRPNTLATYTTLLDNWIVPTSVASACARSPARRSTPTRRRSAPTAPALRRSTARSASSRASSTAPSSGGGSPGTRSSASAGSRTRASETIDARTPETVEAIRAQLDPGDAALVSVLAYEGLRPGEAYALVWGDVLDERGRPRKRLRVRRALRARRSRRRSRDAAASPSSSARSLASSWSSTSPAGSPTRRRSSSPTARAATCAVRTGGGASGSPRSSAPASLLPQLRPPPHLRHAAALRGPHAQRGRRAPRPRRSRVHRAHLRARDARHDTEAPRPDHDSDPHGPSRRLP